MKLKEFESVTPKGNTFSGLINKKHNRNLGSLNIKKVNGEPCEQYVQGFPKIHYYDEKHQIVSTCTAFEKLDGSCIAVYPLLDSEGEIIEIIYKSRGLPVADKNLMSMINLLDKSKINKFFNDENNINKVLYFELYGIKNLHSIKHINTYIDLALIGVSNNGYFMNGKELINFSKLYDFTTSKPLFTIKHSGTSDSFKIIFNKEFIKTYGEYYDCKEKIVCKDILEGVGVLEEILETVNTNFMKINNRLALEGVVLNGLDKDYNQLYIKVKPKTIMIEHKSVNGVPKNIIKKEVYKFFDEYGSTAKELYINNKEFIFNYIKENLGEEFNTLMIENSNKKIENVFLEVARSKEVPDSVNNICNDLIERYPDKNISELMRIFAQENPYNKKDANLVYGVLKLKRIPPTSISGGSSRCFKKYNWRWLN